MKTVMKKLLSLMLVAILLVSAVPFQASAAEGEGEGGFSVKLVIKNDATDKIIHQQDAIQEEAGAAHTVAAYLDYHFAGWSDNYENPRYKLNGEFVGANTTVTEDAKLGIFLSPKAAPTDPSEDEEETTAPSEDEEDETTAPSEDEEDETTAPSEDEEDETTAPSEDEEDETTAPSEDEEDETTAPSEDEEDETTAPSEDDEEEDEPQKKTVKFINELNDETVYIAEDDNGKITTPSQGDFVPGYSFKGWKAAGSSKLLGEGKTYKAKNLADVYYASYTQTYEEDDNTLNVYVRRYVGSTRKETVLIHTKTGLMSNDKVLEYLGTVKSDLINKIQDLFPGYYWSGNYYNYYGNEIATANNLTTDGAKNVYINIYTDETDVLVYVYKATTKSYDRLIEIPGYVAGETVTYNSVLSQVKKYYSGSNMSMTMYDAEGWADYKDGKSNTSTKGVYVENDGTTKIYVYLKNASSTSSSSKADSSNPKTGDTIFMAVTVMAVSASALALVYFFNKKRLAR